jgi:hypothetical protein
MDSKRKTRGEECELEQWDEYHRKRPKVHEFFLKEKRQLLNGAIFLMRLIHQEECRI